MWNHKWCHMQLLSKGQHIVLVLLRKHEMGMPNHINSCERQARGKSNQAVSWKLQTEFICQPGGGQRFLSGTYVPGEGANASDFLSCLVSFRARKRLYSVMAFC